MTRERLIPAQSSVARPRSWHLRLATGAGVSLLLHLGAALAFVGGWTSAEPPRAGGQAMTVTLVSGPVAGGGAPDAAKTGNAKNTGNAGDETGTAAPAPAENLPRPETAREVDRPLDAQAVTQADTAPEPAPQAASTTAAKARSAPETEIAALPEPAAAPRPAPESASLAEAEPTTAEPAPAVAAETAASVTPPRTRSATTAPPEVVNARRPDHRPPAPRAKPQLAAVRPAPPAVNLPQPRRKPEAPQTAAVPSKVAGKAGAEPETRPAKPSPAQGSPDLPEPAEAEPSTRRDPTARQLAERAPGMAGNATDGEQTSGPAGKRAHAGSGSGPGDGGAAPRAGNPSPRYPNEARRRGWEGRVLLEVAVGPDGRVREVRELDSSGHDVLDRAAVEAVRQWRFTPATRFGQPVADTVKVPVRFALRNG